MNFTDDDRVFEELLEYLRRSRGFDFTGYKRTSLKRRVRKQMQLRELNSFEAYLDYLQVHQEEFQLLFNTILINVTTFFRDKSAWKYLQEHTIPHLIEGKSPRSPIRIWSAGCASGEEAYTLAILFAEVLGVESFRQRVKIYATDVDEEALNQARLASYTSQQIDPIPPELRDRFFELQGERYIFRPDLRRAVIFGRHDLVQDAPISRLDLLVCRNTLMYFNAETQVKILNRFHFALNDSGFLFLGKAEMLLTHANLFTPVNLQHRIFSRIATSRKRSRPMLIAENINFAEEEVNNNSNFHWQLRELAFDTGAIAQIIIDLNGTIVLANASARNQFGINSLDLGRPLQDLEISYRPLELRSTLEKIYQERQIIIRVVA